MSRVCIFASTDAAVIATLHAACFWKGWGADEVATMLATPHTHALVAADETQTPCGVLLWRNALDEADILTLAVLPEHRRRGIAQHLLQHALALWPSQGVARVVLEVAAPNEAAIALYHRLGWQEIGRRPHYYAQPNGTRADALVMARGVE